MYEVKATGEKISSFLAAVKVANAANSEVIEVATGLSRWAPAEKPSAKKMRMYAERKAAYDAQEAYKARCKAA